MQVIQLNFATVLYKTRCRDENEVEKASMAVDVSRFIDPFHLTRQRIRKQKYNINIDPTSNRHFNMLWENIAKTGAGISEEVFSLALRGFSKLQASNRLSKDSILAIVDFSKSSREKDFTSSISKHRH